MASRCCGFGTLDSNLEDAEIRAAALHAHGDMDMMHDALRADVLSALAASTPDQIAIARQDVDTHAARFRREVDALGRFDLPAEEIRAAIGALTPKLTTYVTAAERLVDAAASTNPGRSGCAWGSMGRSGSSRSRTGNSASRSSTWAATSVMPSRARRARGCCC